jgi:hypothetical protein
MTAYAVKADDATTGTVDDAPESQASTHEGVAGDPLSDFKSAGKLLLTWVGTNSGIIAALTSIAVGGSFALVTVYYTRLMQRLGTTSSAVGFDNQELITRALVGFAFLVPLFTLLFYWIWLWSKEWTGSEWHSRLRELGLCESILTMVAVFCTAKHSQLEGPTAGLAAMFPILCLSRIFRLAYMRFQRLVTGRRPKGMSTRQPPNVWVVWLTFSVAVIAFLYANVETSADKDAVVIRQQLGAESMLSIIAPFQPTVETVRHVDPTVAESEGISVGDQVLELADHDGNKVLLLQHRPRPGSFSRTATVASASIQLDVTPPG